MTNFPFDTIDEFDDVEVKGLWRTLVETGQVPAEELLANLRQTSRDHARTPMQWTAQPNGGFSTGRPWLAVNPNFTEINAASQVDDPDSVFTHHRGLIALRTAHPALVHGAYRDIDPAHEQVFGYTRTLRRHHSAGAHQHGPGSAGLRIARRAGDCRDTADQCARGRGRIWFDHRHTVRVAGDDLHGRPGMRIEPPRNPRRAR